MEKSRLRAAILNAASRNAALVVKNAKIVNVFTEEILDGDVHVTLVHHPLTEALISVPD